MSDKKSNSGPRAVKRHAALVAGLRKEEEHLKEELYNLRIQNKENRRSYRADIKKLLKEERPLAKEKLRIMTEEMKEAENLLKQEIKETIRKRKERERAIRN